MTGPQAVSGVFLVEASGERATCNGTWEARARQGPLAEQPEACHRTAGEWLSLAKVDQRRWLARATQAQRALPTAVLRQVREQGI